VDGALTAAGRRPVAGRVIRTLQRYAVPQFVAALYYSLRYRCYVSAQARVQLTGQIAFGRGTVVKPFAMLQTQGGRICTGQHSAIGSFNHLSAGLEDIVLGHYVRLGPHVTILGGSHNFRQRDRLIIEQGSYHGPVAIEDDVLIGAGAVILPGTRIGRGAVVGALSLVTRDVPAYAIVGGAPAKVLGERR
jgi:acetyltransferase-like isoleucine patch superfamily enzyme